MVRESIVPNYRSKQKSFGTLLERSLDWFGSILSFLGCEFIVREQNLAIGDHNIARPEVTR